MNAKPTSSTAPAVTPTPAKPKPQVTKPKAPKPAAKKKTSFGFEFGFLDKLAAKPGPAKPKPGFAGFERGFLDKKSIPRSVSQKLGLARFANQSEFNVYVAKFVREVSKNINRNWKYAECKFDKEKSRIATNRSSGSHYFGVGEFYERDGGYERFYLKPKYQSGHGIVKALIDLENKPMVAECQLYSSYMIFRILIETMGANVFANLYDKYLHTLGEESKKRSNLFRPASNDLSGILPFSKAFFVDRCPMDALGSSSFIFAIPECLEEHVIGWHVGQNVFCVGKNSKDEPLYTGMGKALFGSGPVTYEAIVKNLLSVFDKPIKIIPEATPKERKYVADVIKQYKNKSLKDLLGEQRVIQALKNMPGIFTLKGLKIHAGI